MLYLEKVLVFFAMQKLEWYTAWQTAKLHFKSVFKNPCNKIQSTWEENIYILSLINISFRGKNVPCCNHKPHFFYFSENNLWDIFTGKQDQNTDLFIYLFCSRSTSYQITYRHRRWMRSSVCCLLRLPLSHTGGIICLWGITQATKINKACLL